MNKITSTRLCLSALFLAGIAFNSCKKDQLPVTQIVSTSDYTGEWNGVTTATRALTGTDILETTVPLAEIMSLRQQDGKDTFNFKDPVTGLNIAGRQGTWYIIQVGNNDDQGVSGAKLLRLRVVTAADRITYTTFTIKALQGKMLVLNNGASKTLTYAK